MVIHEWAQAEMAAEANKVVDASDAFSARRIADSHSRDHGDSPDVRRAIAAIAFWSAFCGSSVKAAVKDATTFHEPPPSAA